jgi:hypothetical protein
MQQIQKCLETDRKQRLMTHLAPQQVLAPQQALEKAPLGQAQGTGRLEERLEKVPPGQAQGTEQLEAQLATQSQCQMRG